MGKMLQYAICVLVSFMAAAYAAPSSDKTFSPVELFNGTSQSIIRIETDFGSGTGFVVLLESHPCIVTCKHVVVDPYAEFEPLLEPGEQPVAPYLKVGFQRDQLFDIQRYWLANNLDLAILDVPAGLQIKTLRLRKTLAQPGETVFAIGFSIGLDRSISQGIVNTVYSDVIVFSAPISSGNSGAPLLDVHGEVVGIVTSVAKPENGNFVQNLNYAIPVALLPLHRP